MYFRSRFVVRSWGVNRTPDVIELKAESPSWVALSLRAIKPEEIKEFYKDDDWIAIVRTKASVPSSVELEFTLDSEPPPATVEEVAKVQLRRAADFLHNFLTITRWRTGVFGDHKLIRCAEGGLEWSVDEAIWNPVHVNFAQVSAWTALGAVQYTPELYKSIGLLLEQNQHEPVAHELLREAWNLMQSSPRSAIILGLASLEVAVKAFVADLVPHSEWLCFEMPAPPVAKMLEELLPKLPVRLSLNGKAFVPNETLSTIKKAILERNRVAHRGTDVSRKLSLPDTLHTIQSVLYLLDYYAGHSWALSNLRDDQIYEAVMRELKHTV